MRQFVVLIDCVDCFLSIVMRKVQQLLLWPWRTDSNCQFPRRILNKQILNRLSLSVLMKKECGSA